VEVVVPTSEALPEVKVKGQRGGAPSVPTEPGRSVLSGQALASKQAASVFDAVSEMPGVAVNGGVRSSGQSFNIRGYTSNEDVLVQVDGVDKAFEKYRFGGTFIEPELLKSIDVRRGSRIEAGAGALGGTVSVTTRDAADLLRPGQRAGARVKVGHGQNNDESLHMAAVYGRPTDALDLLAASSRRSSNDIRKADGSDVQLSASDAGSDLLKASWFPADGWQLTLSHLAYRDQALTAYDATGGDPGLFGQVQRRIDDATTSARLQWRDESAGHRADLTIGRSETRVRDHFEPWMKSFVSNSSTGAVDDDIRYQGTQYKGSARWRASGVESQGLDFHFGAQGSESDRAVTRFREIAVAGQTDGFNAAQPPGSRSHNAAYVQADWRVGAWQWLPGWRVDAMKVGAAGRTLQALEAAGQPSVVSYRHEAPSLTVVHTAVPGQLTFTVQHHRNFRPPLIDEVFMQGAYGRCVNALLTRGVSGYSATSRVVPASGICADAYDLERSETLEASIWSQLGSPDRVRWEGRLTAFDTRTEHLLESLQAEAGGSGRLVQLGWETRRGLEMEAQLDGRLGPGRWRVDASWSALQGTYHDGRQTRGLTTAPARSNHLGVGWHQGSWSARLTYKRVSDRLVVLSEAYPADLLGIQEGHQLLGLGLRWQPQPWIETQLQIDNLENEDYRLNDASGGGVGTWAAGRQLRLTLALQY
jgi:hemoglobin/transferrin/lactoferrin receptor protein